MAEESSEQQLGASSSVAAVSKNKRYRKDKRKWREIKKEPFDKLE